MPRLAITESSLARAENRAREARERGMQAGNAGRPAVGARYVRAGLRQLGWAENGNPASASQIHAAHHALAARLLMILAELEADQGRTEYALRLLDRAESLAVAGDRGVLLGQRGIVYELTGRGDDALRTLGDAVAILDGNAAETANLAMALLNRSWSYLNIGQVRQARADLAWCRRVAEDEGHEVIAAKAVHNLGCCDLLAGDIPAALLYVGTTTVISSVARVADDDAAVSIMTGYHRSLRAGARPAEALARAADGEPFSPFVCFGAG